MIFDGTEKVLLERQREYGNDFVPILAFFSYKPWFSVPGRRFPRARDKQEVLAQSLQQDVALLDCDPFFAGLSARAFPAGVAAFHFHSVTV